MSGGWSRWLAYAKAKLDDVVRQGHRELDQAEADLERDAADRPWLRTDGDSPTVDQVGEKIRHQAEQAERASRRRAEDGAPGDHDGHVEAADPNQPSLPGLEAGPAEPAPRAAGGEDPQEQFERNEQDRRSADRLEQIRRELGLDEGDDGPGSGADR